jgi:hypothetical protein
MGGYSPGIYLSDRKLLAELTAQADNVADQQELAALPVNAASQLSPTLFVTTAQEKAWA